jgi:chromosomal replication initiator protein
VVPRLIKPVISAVAKYYDVSLGDLVSCRRTSDVVWARHVAMYLAKELTEHSLPTIGRVFGRGHSSVQHACRRIAALRLEQAQLDADLRELTDLLTRPIPDLAGDRRDGVEHE